MEQTNKEREYVKKLLQTIAYDDVYGVAIEMHLACLIVSDIIRNELNYQYVADIFNHLLELHFGDNSE